MRVLCYIIILFPALVFSQKTKVQFEFDNSTATSIEIYLYGGVSNPDVLFSDEILFIPLTNGKATWIHDVSRPVSIRLYYETNDSKSLDYRLFLSPGDDIIFRANEVNLPKSVKVKGKGSENNQPVIQSLHVPIYNVLNENYGNDTLPYNALRYLNDRTHSNQKILKEYCKKHKVSSAFLTNETSHNQYYTLISFANFMGGQRYNLGKAFSRNEEKWQGVFDSLMRANPMNNDELLWMSNYAQFIREYLIRTKEQLWFHPELRKNYFVNEDEEKQIMLDPENLLKERIIDKQFSGRTAEYLYATIFRDGFNEKDDNLPEIYQRFKVKYPQSEYSKYIEPGIQVILEKRKHTLNQEMVLIDEDDLPSTFEEVLSMFAGKTVLLDMWGTWCGPCRRELAENSEAIKLHYKESPLEFLYIANYDSMNEAKWRDLVAYYNLSGTHILASEELTKDILQKTNIYGFPSYLILKKDGSWELLESQSLSNRTMTYDQIDRVLNE